MLAGASTLLIDLIVSIPLYSLRDGKETTAGNVLMFIALLAVCSGNIGLSYFLTDRADEDFREDWIWGICVGEGMLCLIIHPISLLLKYVGRQMFGSSNK
jgi:hypothetical protein